MSNDANTPDDSAREIPTLSLFSGAGGLDLGFHAAGFRVVEAVEIEAAYCATLRANAEPGRAFEGLEVHCKDIREFVTELDPARYRDAGIEFIIGGPPCQTFSAAGRRSGGVLGTDDERGQLFKAYCDILEAVEPKGFVFENVYGLPGANGGGPWREIVAAFSELGYTLRAEVLDAADYGVPQHRERLIMVGYRNGEFEFPLPTHGPDARSDRPLVSAGEAIEDLQDPDETFHANHLGGRYGHLLALVPPGLNYSFFTQEMGYPEPIFAWRSKFHDFLHKTDPTFPARTIKAKPGKFTGPFHWKNRHFTAAELKRLQSFPDDYEIRGTYNKVVEQIGNSVPPGLATMVATAVREQLLEPSNDLRLPRRPAGFKSTFRQRQRERTEHFKRVATAEIAHRFPTGKAAETERRAETEMFYVVATGFFDLHRRATPLVPHPEGARQYRVEVTWNDEHVAMSFANVTVTDVVGTPASIEMTGLRKYLGGIDTLTADAILQDAGDIFQLWTAVEDALVSRSKFFTLIDIYGHYANRGDTVRIRSAFKLDDVASLPLGLEFFGRSESCGVALDYDEVVSRLGLTRDRMEELVAEMRRLRFDVRTRRTHPTLAANAVICTYPFPLLSAKAHLERRVATVVREEAAV